MSCHASVELYITVSHAQFLLCLYYLILNNWHVILSHPNCYVITTVTVYLFTLYCCSTYLLWCCGPWGAWGLSFPRVTPILYCVGPWGACGLSSLRVTSILCCWALRGVRHLLSESDLHTDCGVTLRGMGPLQSERSYLGGKWWRCPVWQSHHYLYTWDGVRVKRSTRECA